MDEADPLLAVEPAVGDWPSASGAAEWLSGVAVRESKLEQAGSPPTLRAARRRDRRHSPVCLGQFNLSRGDAEWRADL